MLEVIKKLAEENRVDKVIETTITDIAKRQAFYDSWDSCAGSRESYAYYTVFYYDGKELSSVEVPVGWYRQGYAANSIDDVEEEEDVYVGDYLNENAIAVLEQFYDSETGKEKVLYILKSVDKQKLKKKIVEKIRECNDLQKLMELYVRLG